MLYPVFKVRRRPCVTITLALTAGSSALLTDTDPADPGCGDRFALPQIVQADAAHAGKSGNRLLRIRIRANPAGECVEGAKPASEPALDEPLEPSRGGNGRGPILR